MNWRAPQSLRARLLWFLLAGIVVAALLQALIAYRAARSEADAIFDYHMQQMALSLRARFPLSMLPDGGDEAGDDAGFDFIVQIWTANGLRIFRTGDVPLPQRAVLGFSDLSANGTRYRVYSMQAGLLVIQVAQDMAARRHMAGEMALRTLVPIALMAPLLMLLVWWVVRSSLAPVARARDQVAQRQPDELAAIDELDLPDEVQPLVHELNLLFARVRGAFDAQKSFVADAAHELRSPLAALKLQVQALQRAPDDPARALAVARLSAGIERATRLVEQLLVLARQQAGAASGALPQPLALAALVRQAVAEMADAAHAAGIDIGLVHADETELHGHAEALRILLRNLLENALKYTPAGGRVDVELRVVGTGASDRLARVMVQDSGPGIAVADRVRVLDRFYRVPGTAPGGSGLGLAIVNAIAQWHGARLILSDAAALGGLCAAVDFPLPGEARTRAPQAA